MPSIPKPTRSATRCALLLAALLVAACSSGERRVDSGTAAGVLHWGNASEPASLDPQIANGVPEQKILSALWEGLVGKHPATLEPIPAGASHWQISADRRSYRFHLRADARWSNGEPVTAEDYRWAWWRALQPELGNSSATMLFPIVNAEAYWRGDIDDFNEVGVRVIDALTLEVELSHPTGYFLQLLDMPTLYPLHRASIERHGAATARASRWSHPGNLVSNGPFQLEQWQINRRIVVTKNPHYWDAAKVALNQIIFYPTENTTTEERMFRAGQLHYSYDVPVNKMAYYAGQRPDQLVVAPYLGSYFYRFNTRRTELADPRVRRALARAIDRRQLTEQVLRAGQLPAYAMTPPNTAGYYPPASAEQQLSFDPAAARALLAEAGYPGGAGLGPIEILYNTQDEHRKVAVAIQQMWKQHLNVDATLQNQEWKVYLDTERRGDYQVTRASWIGDYVDARNFLEIWLCDSDNNRTGWCDPQFDQLLIEQLPAATSQAERHRLLRRAEQRLLDGLPLLPIYTYTSKHLVHPDLKGYTANLLNQPLFKQLSLVRQPQQAQP